MTELSVDYLERLRKRYERKIDEGARVELEVLQSQLQDWLSRTVPSDMDYSLIKAIVDGELDIFMGFKFKVKKNDEVITVDLRI